jgi:MFS family permease
LNTSETLQPFRLKGQGPVYMVGIGHGAIHWFAMTVMVLLPYIRQDMSLTGLQVGALVSVFHIVSALTNVFSGPAIDITGRRVLFQILAVGIGGAGLLVFGFTANYVVMATMMALMGVANNIWHPAGISFLSMLYPNNRGYVLSIHASGANLGDAIAPFVAGVLLVWFSWQETAVISSLPVFLVGLLLIIIVLPKDKITKEGPRRGVGASDYVSGLKMMIKDKAVVGLCLMAAFRTAAQVGLFTFIPLYLVEVMKASPLFMGSNMTAMQLTGVVASLIAGTASDKVGVRPIVMMGLTATTLIIAGLTFIQSEYIYIICIAVLGFCLYAIRPVVHSWLMALVPDHMAGSATSLMFGIQSVFGAATPLIGGYIMDVYGIIYVFYFIAGMILTSNIIVFTLPKVDPGPRKG